MGDQSEVASNEVPLSHAAQRLRLSPEAARRRIATGALDGRQVLGRWVVTEQSVQRLEHAMRQPVSAA